MWRKAQRPGAAIGLDWKAEGVRLSPAILPRSRWINAMILATSNRMLKHAMTDLVPVPEPEVVAGRPNIYGIYYPNVAGWYIGKNETGNSFYMGSPSDAVRKKIHDAHNDACMPEVSEKHILWSPADATREECRNQEWIWIARFRSDPTATVFNLFPTLEWDDHFRWEHDELTHVDRAINSKWRVVYLKLQASRDENGNCDYRRCGLPWGAQLRGLHWCKVIYPDGREEWLLEPSPRGNAYDAFRKHKFAMIHQPSSD